MGFFTGLLGSKEERKTKAEYRKEKSVEFQGKTLQKVGSISKGTDVTLKLDPQQQVLNISCDENDMKVSLPYSRITGFYMNGIKGESKEISKDLIGFVLSSGILGRGVIGTGGRIAASLLKKHKQSIVWIGVLTYKDKMGNETEISFAKDAEEIEDDEEEKDYCDQEFELAVNGIVLRYNPSINEL